MEHLPYCYIIEHDRLHNTAVGFYLNIYQSIVFTGGDEKVQAKKILFTSQFFFELMDMVYVFLFDRLSTDYQKKRDNLVIIPLSWRFVIYE